MIISSLKPIQLITNLFTNNNRQYPSISKTHQQKTHPRKSVEKKNNLKNPNLQPNLELQGELFNPRNLRNH